MRPPPGARLFVSNLLRCCRNCVPGASGTTPGDTTYSVLVLTLGCGAFPLVWCFRRSRLGRLRDGAARPRPPPIAPLYFPREIVLVLCNPCIVQTSPEASPSTSLFVSRCPTVPRVHPSALLCTLGQCATPTNPRDPPLAGPRSCTRTSTPRTASRPRFCLRRCTRSSRTTPSDSTRASSTTVTSTTTTSGSRCAKGVGVGVWGATARDVPAATACGDARCLSLHAASSLCRTFRRLWSVPTCSA